MIRRYTKYLIFIGLMVGLFGCGGDSSTGPDPSEAPELPDLQNQDATMDISFFENTNPKASAASATTNNYEDAETTVLTYENVFINGGPYQAYVDAAGVGEPTYNNGVWEWTFDYQYQGMSLEIRTTAEELTDEVQWAQYWTYDDGEGNSYQDYKIFEGTVSNDGSSGSWIFNVLDPDGTQEVPAVESSWEIISDTQKELFAEFYDGSGNLEGTYEYIQDGAEHTLTITSTSSSDDIVVYWNTDTGAGYYQSGGTQCSWDSQQQDAGCS